MNLSDKIIDLAKKGYEVSFRRDDIACGLIIRIQKDNCRYEHAIGFYVLERLSVGSEFISLHAIDRMVYEIDKEIERNEKRQHQRLM